MNTEKRQRARFLFVNSVTLARIPLAVVFAVVLLTQERSPTVLLVCAAVLGLSEVTDLLDGLLARRLGVVSATGALLDPYADSLTRLIVYWALACDGLVLAVVPLAMAVRDVSVSYCRIVLSRYGGQVSANWSGKIKAVIQGGGAVLLTLGPVYTGYTGLWITHVFSTIILLVTLGSAVQYATAARAATRGSNEQDAPPEGGSAPHP